MSVLMEFAIFPTDKGESVSKYVAPVIKIIQESGYPYQFTPMGTIVEVEEIEEATQLLNRAYRVLEPEANRVYIVAKMDIRKRKKGRIIQKIKSVEEKLAQLDKRGKEEG
ncbi:MAG: MTH1187 family thiamine-binding protein [Campylobacterales bacterium]